MTRLGFHCHDLGHLDTVIGSTGLQRGEFYNFPSQSLLQLEEEVERRSLATSVHAPLVRSPWYPMPPTLSFLCDVDESKRQLSLRMIQETMELAERFGAEYVVAHFPVPCSADGNNVDYGRLRQIAWESATRLAEMSQKHGIPIHIEGFGPSPFLSVEFLGEVMRTFDCLCYCFDTGHMHIAAQREGFDLHEFAEQLAPFIGSVHLWNNRGLDDYLSYGHIPVHPSQKPESGWVDVAPLLRSILSSNPSCCVIFESGIRYPKALGGHDFRDGVKWVKELVSGLS
jgi:sugar phosphate isomerase/epimerase